MSFLSCRQHCCFLYFILLIFSQNCSLPLSSTWISTGTKKIQGKINRKDFYFLVVSRQRMCRSTCPPHYNVLGDDGTAIAIQKDVIAIIGFFPTMDTQAMYSTSQSWKNVRKQLLFLIPTLENDETKANE